MHVQRNARNLKIPEIEKTKILKFWQENKIFEKSKSSKLKSKSFSFYDGPPFLSGKPHYGHILATVIKDAVARFWTMKGFRVERKAGWDCHGLPVENLIEQKLNLKNKKRLKNRNCSIQRFLPRLCLELRKRFSDDIGTSRPLGRLFQGLFHFGQLLYGIGLVGFQKALGEKISL